MQKLEKFLERASIQKQILSSFPSPQLHCWQVFFRSHLFGIDLAWISISLRGIPILLDALNRADYRV